MAGRKKNEYRLVKTIGPSPAKKAQVKASGYADGPAGWGSRVWQGFWDTSESPLLDIDENVALLRERSRSVWYRSGLARNILRIYCDWVVGSGLDLKSEASEGGDVLEGEWNAWACSRTADSRGDADFFSLSRQIFESMLMNGDVFCILRRVSDTDGKFRLRIEAVEADLCRFDGAKDGRRIVQGIELNRYGEAVAYHFVGADGKSRRVARFDEDGQVQVIHMRLRERIGSVRGVPLLTPCLEPILQMERYMGSELQSALLESCFSVFVKSDEEDPESLVDNPLPPSVYNLALGSGNINFLPMDAEISSIDGHRDRNAGSLEKFVEVMLKTNICSGVSIPFEILTNQFSSSYSASRASCLLFARRAEQMRDGFVLDFVQPVFEAWLDVKRMNGEEVPDDASKATWCGPQPPSLDPVKTVDYLERAVKAGFMTRKQASQELSRTDFESNVRSLSVENAMLASANRPLDVPERSSTEQSSTEDEDFEEVTE